MKKYNKILIVLLLVLTICLVGLTIAYFSNSTSLDNIFKSKDYGTTYTEEFVSPDNWLPGDVTEKSITATNTGSIDQAIRISYTESWTPNKSGETLSGWIHPDGTKSNHTTASELETDEKVAVIKLANTSDWSYEGGYWYYNGKNNVQIKKEFNGETTYDFWKFVYHNIDFDNLTEVGHDY